MYIDNIVLEVTRSCNLKCKHCMRGCAERCHFNTCYLDNIFDGVDSVGVITFSGGEPLLKIGTIVKTLDYIREHNIGLGGFYIAHNGTIFSKYLMNILKDYYDNYVDEPCICGFSLSTDKFHLESIKNGKLANRYYDYMELKEYECGYDFIYDDRKEITILVESGRGSRNRNRIVAKYHRRPSFYNGFVQNEYGSYDDMMVYIASNGNVISDCDLSFNIVDKYSLGNIKKTSLAEILHKNTVEEENWKKIEL